MKMRSHDDLANESTLSIGKNIFSSDLDAARAAIAKDPWIHDVEIARRLPGTDLAERHRTRSRSARLRIGS